MFNLHKEIKVALLVIVSITMLYTGFNFLKGVDFFSSQYKYYAVYTDVNGLMVGNPVIVNGLAVGRVSDIAILPADAHKLKVTIDIDKMIKINDSTQAMISSTDLLGTKCIRLTLGNSESLKLPKSEIQGTVEPGFTDKLSQQASPIVQGLSTSLDQLALLMNAKNIETISRTLKEIELLTKQLNRVLAQNERTIQSSLNNVELVSKNLVKMQTSLLPILANIGAVSDSLKKMPLATTVASTNQALSELDKMLELINKGEGTLGKLAKDDSLYTHINHTAASLDALLKDLKSNPKRYVHFSVFGKKAK